MILYLYELGQIFIGGVLRALLSRKMNVSSTLYGCAILSEIRYSQWDVSWSLIAGGYRRFTKGRIDKKSRLAHIQAFVSLIVETRFPHAGRRSLAGFILSV